MLSSPNSAFVWQIPAQELLAEMSWWWLKGAVLQLKHGPSFNVKVSVTISHCWQSARSHTTSKSRAHVQAPCVRRPLGGGLEILEGRGGSVVVPGLTVAPELHMIPSKDIELAGSYWWLVGNRAKIKLL